MTPEERAKIVSNDYADFIIDWNSSQSILDQFPNVTIQIMNQRFAIGYAPASQLNNQTVSRYGYSILPAVFALMSRRSLEASGVVRLRNVPTLNLRGQGVLVGVIDTGIDYTNPVFIREDGTTKIISLWDQNIESADQFPVDAEYGTVYNAEQINEALGSENPLEVVPSTDEIGHGTMIAGIAVGSENMANNFSGVVPDADLVVVKLKQAKQNLKNFYVIPSDVPCYQENDIMWASQYLISVARQLGRPISICIGLGGTMGAHDGFGALSAMISVGGDFSGVVVSIAAGNEGSARGHYYAAIDPAIGYNTVELNVGANEPGFTMELWGSSPNTYSIDILSPSGEYIPRIGESIRLSREISFIFENTIININYEMVESSTGDELILLKFRNPSEGTWRFQVYGRGDLQGSFHIWLPPANFISPDTYFLQSNPYTTITSPGNSLVPITTTAYNPETDTLYQQASRGYSRINTIKPELAAPGVNITAPNLQHGFSNFSGTGAATAHMTGITAMLLEWGVVRRNYPGLDTVEAKKFLIRGARRNEILQYPNRDWGYGIVDIYNTFNLLRSDTRRP